MISEFELRQKKLIEFAYKIMSDNIERFGTWKVGYRELYPQRYALWSSLGLYRHGSAEIRALGDKMILEAGTLPAECNFCPNLSTELLVKYEKIMSEKVKEKLKQLLKISFNYMLDPSMDFIGVNDNFPAMATYTALVGGEYFGRKDAVETGKKRLEQLYKMLKRRGLPSEFTSPNYSAFTLNSIAGIVNDVQDSEMREMALHCEEWLWYDLSAHYHPILGVMAGPYSRAYSIDTLAFPNIDRLLYYLAWGAGKLEDCFVYHPVENMKNPAEYEYLVQGELEARGCAISANKFHLSQNIMKIALDKKYPFQIAATAELAPSRYHDKWDVRGVEEKYKDIITNNDRLDEYPAASTVNVTYMTPEYAIGTALRPFHSGVQTDSFHVVYKKTNPLPFQKDKGIVFARYIINDKKPGQQNESPWFETVTPPGCLDDEGRKFGLQYRNMSLMVYKPTYYEHNSIRNLKLSVIMPAFQVSIGEIWLGDRKVDDEFFESIEQVPIYISDGSVYMSFIPLTLTNHGRKAAIRVENENGFSMISLYNYEGAPKALRKNEMLLTSNGFVAVIEPKDKYKSFEEFRMKFGKYDLKDETAAYTHTRWAHCRKVYFRHESTEFEFAYSPMTEGIKYATINGELLTEHRLKMEEFQ